MRLLFTALLLFPCIAIADTLDISALKQNLEKTLFIIDKSEKKVDGETVGIAKEAKALIDSGQYVDGSLKLHSAMFQLAASEMITPGALTSTPALSKKFFEKTSKQDYPTGVMLVGFWNMVAVSREARTRLGKVRPKLSEPQLYRSWCREVAPAGKELEKYPLELSEFVSSFVLTGSYVNVGLMSELIHLRVASKAFANQREKVSAFMTSVDADPIAMQKAGGLPDYNRYLVDVERRAAEILDHQVARSTAK